VVNGGLSYRFDTLVSDYFAVTTYAPQSSRFGSEPPSVEDDVDVWRYAILELHTRNDDPLL